MSGRAERTPAPRDLRRTIEQYLPDHPFFAGLDESAVALLRCAIASSDRPARSCFE